MKRVNWQEKHNRATESSQRHLHRPWWCCRENWYGMTTKRSQDETNPGRNTLVEERRIHGKARGQDVATYSKHPALDTSLSPSVRINREEDNRRRITPQGLNSTQWYGQIEATVYMPTLFSLQSQPWTHTVRMQRWQLQQLQRITQPGWCPCPYQGSLVYRTVTWIFLISWKWLKLQLIH